MTRGDSMNIGEYMKALKKQMQDFGITCIETADGKSVTSLEIDDGKTNIYDISFGGVLFHLCDLTAGWLYLENEEIGVTVSGNIEYINPAPAGTTVYCEATMLKKGRKLSYIDTKVTAEGGKLVSKASFVFAKLSS